MTTIDLAASACPAVDLPVWLPAPAWPTGWPDRKRFGQGQWPPLRRAHLSVAGSRVLLGAESVHSGRSAFDHLLAQAQTHGIPRRRVDEVIELTGLQFGGEEARGVASPPAWASGWGSPRPCLATRPTIVLDEPVNGLDPEGVLWIRNLLSGLAADGRTVFVSSHLMSEMALVAEHLPPALSRRGAGPVPRSATAAAGAGICTPDCIMPEGSPQTVLNVPSSFDPNVKGYNVDLAKTLTTEFALQANKRGG